MFFSEGFGGFDGNFLVFLLIYKALSSIFKVLVGDVKKRKSKIVSFMNYLGLTKKQRLDKSKRPSLNWQG